MAIDPPERPRGRRSSRQPLTLATPPSWEAAAASPSRGPPPPPAPPPAEPAQTRAKKPRPRPAAKIDETAPAAPAQAATAPVPEPRPAVPPRAAAPKPSVGASPLPPPPAAAPSTLPMPNIEALSRNIARLIEEGGKVAAAFLAPRESGEVKSTLSEDMSDAVSTLGKVAEHYYSDPQRAFQAQAALSTQFMALWASTLQRMNGESTRPVAPPEPSDKRFADPEWRANPYFDFLAQAYMLTTRWAGDLVRKADEIDPHTRDKAQFYLRQLAAALSRSPVASSIAPSAAKTPSRTYDSKSLWA